MHNAHSTTAEEKPPTPSSTAALLTTPPAEESPAMYDAGDDNEDDHVVAQSPGNMSGAENTEKSIVKSDSDTATPSDDEIVYPGIMTKVAVGIGLALAVFLVLAIIFWRYVVRGGD
jgi:hypothetical protein